MAATFQLEYTRDPNDLPQKLTLGSLSEQQKDIIEEAWASNKVEVTKHDDPEDYDRPFSATIKVAGGYAARSLLEIARNECAKNGVPLHFVKGAEEKIEQELARKSLPVFKVSAEKLFPESDEVKPILRVTLSSLTGKQYEEANTIAETVLGDGAFHFRDVKNSVSPGNIGPSEDKERPSFYMTVPCDSADEATKLLLALETKRENGTLVPNFQFQNPNQIRRDIEVANQERLKMGGLQK